MADYNTISGIQLQYKNEHTPACEDCMSKNYTEYKQRTPKCLPKKQTQSNFQIEF